jgi:hypothetical protein
MKNAVKSKRHFKVGDYVREVDGEAIGFVVLCVRDEPDLVIVRWPPDRQGYCYHRDDLVKI